MPTVSKYERDQIAALLQSTPAPPIDPGSGLALFDLSTALGRRVYDGAVSPAFRAAGLNCAGVEVAFNDFSSLATAAHAIQSAEAIVVDLSNFNPIIFYCLGLAHALGRSPILITSSDDDTLPFNLNALRCLHYARSQSSLRALRERLARALRVFIDSARNS